MDAQLIVKLRAAPCTTGKVIAACKQQHRAKDFVAFLDEIDRSVEAGLTGLAMGTERDRRVGYAGRGGAFPGTGTPPSVHPAGTTPVVGPNSAAAGAIASSSSVCSSAPKSRSS